jgi:hypothetical protein
MFYCKRKEGRRRERNGYVMKKQILWERYRNEDKKTSRSERDKGN